MEVPPVLPGLDNQRKALCFTLPAAEHQLHRLCLGPPGCACLIGSGEPWRCGRCRPQIPSQVHSRASCRKAQKRSCSSGCRQCPRPSFFSWPVDFPRLSYPFSDVFRSAHFNSLDDAFWSWCSDPSWKRPRKFWDGCRPWDRGGNMSGRMSQSTFMRAMREINYQGDAKLVWAWPPWVLIPTTSTA